MHLFPKQLLLKKGESKSSTKDQHVLGSASNIVTPNVVVMGPVSNITVTGGNAQQALEEQPPKYEESSRVNDDNNC